jgi:hypothetical protein
MQNDKEYVNYKRMCELYIAALVTRWSAHCYACNQAEYSLLRLWYSLSSLQNILHLTSCNMTSAHF